MRVWNASTLAHVKTIKVSESSWITDCKYFGASNRLAVACVDRSVYLYDNGSYDATCGGRVESDDGGATLTFLSACGQRGPSALVVAQPSAPRRALRDRTRLEKFAAPYFFRRDLLELALDPRASEHMRCCVGRARATEDARNRLITCNP